MTSQYQIEVERHPFAGEGFKIARGTKTVATTVKLTLEQDGLTGVGEGVPLQRYGQTAESVVAQLQDFCARSCDLATLEDLPAGPARFALDTALTQLAAQRSGQTLPEFLGLTPPPPIPTAFTLSLDTPEKMAATAATRRDFAVLKLKLGREGDNLARLAAIHAAAPHAKLILDANESLTPDTLAALLADLARYPVVLMEQPLPAGDDAALLNFASPIPIAADESCHTLDDLPALQGKYQVVNLKLDKTGGLHHALEMARVAREMGFDLMVGCMGSTSLSIAPALLLAHATQAAYVDLDGALLLQRDPYDLVNYAEGRVALSETVSR